MNSFRFIGYCKFLFCFLVFILYASCNDNMDDDGDEMMEEIALNEIVSFEVSGIDTTFVIDELDNNGPKAKFQLMEPSFVNGDSLSRLLTLRARSGSSVLSINLEINVTDADSCIPEQVYRMNSSSTGEGVLFLDFTYEGEFYTTVNGQEAGYLEITNCDFEQGLISGKFDATFVDSNGFASIRISKGSFEGVCLQKE